MIRLNVRHTVADYDAWRRAYDDFDTERRSMGVRGAAVYRQLDDGNDLTVWHDFDDRRQADAFAASDRLREVMASAGVVGAPDIWMVQEA